MPEPSIDHRITMSFTSHDETSVYRLLLHAPADFLPNALLADLSDVGFTVDPSTTTPHPAMRYPGVNDPPGGEPVECGWDQVDLVLTGPDGRADAGVWTQAERRRHLRAAKAVLRRHGVTGLPFWSDAKQSMVPDPDRRS
jgi:hypothetical protein